MDVQIVIQGIFALMVVAVISYLIAVDANKKGRSGILWALLCFFTCLIAIPIYFLLITQEKDGV